MHQSYFAARATSLQSLFWVLYQSFLQQYFQPYFLLCLAMPLIILNSKMAGALPD